jgi:hypothetical protein
MCSLRTACLGERKERWRVKGGDDFGGQLALDNEVDSVKVVTAAALSNTASSLYAEAHLHLYKHCADSLLTDA